MGQIGSKMKQVTVFFLCLCCLSACGNRPDEEIPVVNVSYFKPLPMEGLAPDFEIGIHIINPSGRTLKFNGISYNIKLEEQRVLVGVSNDLPDIGPYSEGDAVIKASTDMVGSFLLISKLIREKQESIKYEFSASLDVAGARRDIKVVRKGVISLRN